MVLHYCCSVAKSCLTVCDPIDCSMPGSSVLQYLLQSLLKFMSIESMKPSNLSSSVALFFCLQSFPASGTFPISLLFSSSGQSIGASALVLPMNIQGWFPLGLTGFISLMSKRPSRVFSSTTIWKHQFFGTWLSLWSNSHIRIWM